MFVIKLKNKDTDEFFLVQRGLFAHATTTKEEESTKFDTKEEAEALWKKLSLGVVWDEVRIVEL